MTPCVDFDLVDGTAETKAAPATAPPSGLVTPAMIEKGIGLELQLAGLEDEEEEIAHRPKRAVKPDDYLTKKTPEQVL